MNEDVLLPTAAMRAVHIVDSISEEAAGPSYSVPRLCEALVRSHWTPQLLTVGLPAEDTGRGFLHRQYAAEWARAPLLGKMRHSLALRRAIDEEAARGALIHSHGLWLMANVYPGWAAKRHTVPLVVSPRGMLDSAALKFSKWRKRAMWHALQGEAARGATLFHATSFGEYNDIRNFGLSQPVAIIPNGVDVPAHSVGAARAKGSQRTILYLGRLHPKKGIGLLLESWRQCQETIENCNLVIAGPSERGYIQELQRTVARHGLRRVSFPGPLYGEAKSRAYKTASLFVMPTLGENFGMTVAEALSMGVPVVCTKGAPWAGLTAHDCGWWTDGDSQSFADALRIALSLSDDELRRMGDRGRAWMEKDFSWPAIAAEMASVYDWLEGRGPVPACVHQT